jgi:hypothetical protein
MLASVSINHDKVINNLMNAYDIPDPLPWTQIAGPLAVAEDALARLDERLAKSPIREGWIARTHFHDACASLSLEGALVLLEDLVLHDAGRDIRTPTHELTRAHAVLRARRRIASAEPGWALTPTGLDGLRGRRPPGAMDGDGSMVGQEADEDGEQDPPDGGDAWAGEIAAIDVLVARSGRTLANASSSRKAERDPLIYDLDWDEDERLAIWRTKVDDTRNWPPVLAAAVAACAWDELTPLQHTPWLGRLLAAALLAARGKTCAHLACLNVGLRAIPRERRWAVGSTASLLVAIDAITAAAEAGLKDHDRWVLARRQLERKLTGRRSTSNLPALIDLVLATPLASAGMIAESLGVTPRAAQDLVAELGVREATGRGRYRAWGIL